MTDLLAVLDSAIEALEPAVSSRCSRLQVQQKPPTGTVNRGRDAHCWAPPAQIRTCGIPASGSYLGCLTAKRWFGQGWRMRGRGSQSSASFVTRAHVV